VKFLIISLAAGLASALGFEPLKLWPVTLIAFALLLWLVERAPSLSSPWRGLLVRRRQLRAGPATGSRPPSPISRRCRSGSAGWPVVLLSLYLAVYPAMAAGLAWRYGRHDRPAARC
jgi:apolipoprotein N-acyltransferase